MFRGSWLGPLAFLLLSTGCPLHKLRGTMFRGSWLGPLAFLVLSTGCPLHKYVDDTTLSKLVQPKQLDIHILTYLANLLTRVVKMNTYKAKEMVLGRLANTNLPLPDIGSQTIVSTVLRLQ